MPDALRPTRRMIAVAAAGTLAFMLLHELTHHAAVRLVCGEWGHMTIAAFFAPARCAAPADLWLATLAGPAMTYALPIAGAAARTRVGIMVVVCNLPLARLATAASSGGDEGLLARTLLGLPGYAIALPLSAALLAWPLAALWRHLPPRRRTVSFCGWLVLPLAWDALVKRMVLVRLLPDEPRLFGVPMAVAAIGFLCCLCTGWLLCAEVKDERSRGGA